MPRAGPKRVLRYSNDFKLFGGQAERAAGIEVHAVAKALDIHLFMLSRRRREVREAVLRGKVGRAEPELPVRETKRLQELERAHALLLEEHELLREPSGSLASEGRTSSRSSSPSGKDSR